MDLHNEVAFTRRRFLGSGLTLASASLTVPAFISASAASLNRALAMSGVSSLPGVDDGRVLVVVQLAGGNDGLNTVIPYGSDAYYKARPGIGVPKDQVLKLGKDSGIGLHPQMTALKELYDEGLAGVVQGVGYPNPNRSHFKSMDIWHTADLTATGDGWLGRYMDSECCGYGAGESGRAPRTDGAVSLASMPGVSIGRSAPLAMQGRTAKPVSFESSELFQWSGAALDPALAEAYARLDPKGDDGGLEKTNAGFLTRTALDAQIASRVIRQAVAQRPLVEYPRTELGRQLAFVASMIRAGLPSRVYYVSLGGFDTHAGQGGAQGRHGQLLGQFAQGIKAFLADLKAQSNDTRVLVMSFSEFGRRVGQNASQGTDHGTAAPMFFFGPMVRPGLLGTYPSLTDLDQGDLKHTVDFRGVYAGVLKDWLQTRPEPVLEGSFRPLGVIRA